MTRRMRLWTSLSAAALIGVAGCGQQAPAPDADEAPQREAGSVPTAEPAPAPAANAVLPGEGGEGGVQRHDLATDDIAYLTRLGLIRGHLLVGVELYRAGHKGAAKTHMKHPRDELYAGLDAAFAARDARGFADALEALASAVQEERSVAEVEAAYDVLIGEIAKAESAVAPATRASLAAQLTTAANLMRVAGEEYALGVENGRLVSAHEYQDAYGFAHVAKQICAAAAGLDDPFAAAAADQAIARINEVSDLWPDINPPAEVDGDASRLYGVAARLDILAFKADQEAGAN